MGGGLASRTMGILALPRAPTSVCSTAGDRMKLIRQGAMDTKHRSAVAEYAWIASPVRGPKSVHLAESAGGSIASERSTRSSCCCSAGEGAVPVWRRRVWASARSTAAS